MRIALCLSGQPRTWRSTRESLMAFFAGCQPDVFLHSWREGEPGELGALVEAYAPRAWRFEERPLFVADKRRLAANFPIRPPLTIFDMFHSVAGSLGLAAESGETYDLVVRARFDARFDGIWSGEPPAEGELVIPDDYPDPASCSDQFALGRPAAMQAYGAFSTWFPAALPQLRGEWLRPEAVLRGYLEQACGLRLKLSPIAMRLRREGLRERPFATMEEDPLFHAAKHEAWEAFALAHFPEVAAAADFAHPSRTPLALDRALDAWAQARGAADAQALFAAPWPSRIVAIDGFLAGGVGELDDSVYDGLRRICAALLQRMDRDAPLEPASAVVHMLSDNIRDMRRVDGWLRATPGAADRAMAAAPAGGLLDRALAYKPPLTAFGHDVWRR